MWIREKTYVDGSPVAHYSRVHWLETPYLTLCNKVPDAPWEAYVPPFGAAWPKEDLLCSWCRAWAKQAAKSQVDTFAEPLS